MPGFQACWDANTKRLGEWREALQCKSNHFQPLLETQAGQFKMKPGFVRGLQGDEIDRRSCERGWYEKNGCSEGEMRTWGRGQKWTPDRKEQRQEELLKGYLQAQKSRQCEKSPGIKANHKKCCALSPQSKPKNSTTFEVRGTKRHLAFPGFF